MKFLKMVSLFLFQSSNIYFHSLSTGVKAWGQFVDKKLKHIFCGRPQGREQDRWTADRSHYRLK